MQNAQGYGQQTVRRKCCCETFSVMSESELDVLTPKVEPRGTTCRDPPFAAKNIQLIL